MKVPQLRKKPEAKSCHNIVWEDNYSWIHQANILEVLKTAKKIGIKSILLTGRRKRNTKLLDLQINVPANRVDRIQEMHIFVGHLICEILEKKLT